MPPMTVSFESSQFDRIFPFFILIVRNLVVESNGKTIEKLFRGIIGRPFFDNFFMIHHADHFFVLSKDSSVFNACKLIPIIL